MCTIFRKLKIICYERDCEKNRNLSEKEIVNNNCLLVNLLERESVCKKKIIGELK